jgi:hypothetical protein
MEPKAPVLLLVLVETKDQRWFAAAIGLDGRVTPLICSEPGDLAHYRELAFDEQVAFLRHRFCGVLQRGCDRLWARNWKACQFVFVFEELLPEPTGTLTKAVADHFTLWMLNPPAAVLVSENGFDQAAAPRLTPLAGELVASRADLVLGHLAEALAARNDPAAWELARQQGVWC